MRVKIAIGLRREKQLYNIIYYQIITSRYRIRSFSVPSFVIVVYYNTGSGSPQTGFQPHT